MSKLCLVLLFGCLSVSSTAIAQSHCAHMGDEPAPKATEAPIHMNGIGNSHLTITTSSPEAQVWFDQGLNLLHDFWDYESLRAFREAARLDPKCAMCYWGIYRAEAFDSEANKDLLPEALNKAKELAPKASEHEQLYIKAASEYEEHKDDDANTVSATPDVRVWEEIIHRFPEDADAKLFLALEVMGGYEDGSKPKEGQIYSEALIRQVLADNPNSAAANHYWIHAEEGSEHPEAALKSAERIGELAPASGHMVHMAGHIFYRVGDYERARTAFLNAVRVDEEYLATQKQGVEHDWNYVHNLMYLIAALTEGGRFKEAAHYSEVLAEARHKSPRILYANMADRSYALLPVDLRYANWDAVLKGVGKSLADPKEPNLNLMRSGIRFYAAGMKAVMNNQLQEAEEQSLRLDATLWRQSQTLHDDEKPSSQHGTDKPDMDSKPVVSFLRIASLELRGAIAIANRRWEEGAKLFQVAEAKESDLGYNEPPRYFRPAQELLGDAYLRSNRWKDAEEAYRKALVLRPNSGFALYGIAQAQAGAGDATAKQSYAKFKETWTHADGDLPQLRSAEAWLHEHAGPVQASLK